MKEVRNKIKLIKAEDGKVALPQFQKTDDGNYVVVGTVDVCKLAEIREYFKEYKEIANLIRQNYKKEIADIFYSALGELVGRASNFGDYSSQRVPVENLGGEFNDVQYISRVEVGNGLPQKTIERILSSDGIGVKRFKPGREITDLMKTADLTGYMVLPEMSDYGVVATPDKQSKTISLRFKRFNEQDAAMIKNYLLSVADSVEDDNLCKRQIEAIFDTSKQLAKVHTPYSDEERELLVSLGQEAVDLMGVDLTPFKKKTRTKVEVTDTNTSNGALDRENDEGEHYVKNPAFDEQDKASEPASDRITKIVVNGLSNFSQGINNGQIQVVLSPTDGFVYTVKLDGKELVAEQTPAEPSNE